MHRTGLAGFLGLAIWLVGMDPARALPLETAPVQRQSVPRVQAFDAVVEAVNQATLAAQTSGRVMRVNFDVDDYVEKGGELIRFTDKEQKARLAASEAGLREAEVRHTQATTDFARIKQTFEQALVAKAVFDKAEADLQAAARRLDAARAGVEEARQQLEYTVVRAPYSGIVVKRHVQPGETVTPGTPLFSGFSLASLRATASIPQHYINAVRKAGSARLQVGAGDGAWVESRAVTVYPYAETTSHTFKVRAKLPDGEYGAFPGMFVKMAFKVGEEDKLLVHAKAVVYRSEVTACYVVDAAGKVGFRQLRVGQAYDDKIEVLSGLQDGEQVALDPIAAGVVLKEQREGSRP